MQNLQSQPTDFMAPAGTPLSSGWTSTVRRRIGMRYVPGMRRAQSAGLTMALTVVGSLREAVSAASTS